MSIKSTLRSGTNRAIGLIETLRYEPEKGCVRAAQHLARMAASAHFLGKSFNQQEAIDKLKAVQGMSSLRLRLLLDDQDDLTLTAHPFVPLTIGKIWAVAVAQTQLNADNTLLAHKTTLRETYETARAEFDTGIIDEVIMTNQHGHVCEGTITNVFVLKGTKLVTPPLADGLLRGVLRQELLDNGDAVEGIIRNEDLFNTQFFVGNSLRGLIPAVLTQA